MHFTIKYLYGGRVDISCVEQPTNHILPFYLYDDEEIELYFIEIYNNPELLILTIFNFMISYLTPMIEQIMNIFI